MTIAWAIVIVAVLYLLDKHHLLKKSLIGTGIVFAVIALGYAGLLGYQQVKKRWEDHQFAKLEYQRFAKLHDCYNPSNGKTHSPNEAHECASGEELIEWGSPSYQQSTQPKSDGAPVVFGNASCAGRTASAALPGSLASNAPETLPADFFSAKYCALIVDRSGNRETSVKQSLESAVIPDGERLNVLGKSAQPTGLDYGGEWYKVKTQDGHDGYLPDLEILCDGSSSGYTIDQWVDNPEYKGPPSHYPPGSCSAAAFE